MAIKHAIKTTMLGFLALFGVLFLQNGTQPSQFFTTQANVALRMAVNQTIGEPLFNSPVSTQGPNRLYAGGSAFGVKVFSDGVMVVGVSEVETANGMKSPASEAGVRAKDIITHINDQKVTRNEQVASMLENSQGEPLRLTIDRKGEILSLTVLPQQGMDGKFKGGLWVRDSTAGIGTFTFFDPATGSFGGLGHGICDVDTGELIPVLEGTVVGAKIVDVNPGQKGSPGELIGVFEESKRIGMVYANTPAGVFGRFHKEYTPTGPLVEIGTKEQIKVGDATIISSADGSPKEYQIRITKILNGTTSAGKNMSIEATDPALLALTGGIVQGMSGSPILQNGKLVGAVTHVLVNDPTKGYGIFIENMLEQVQ